MTDDEIIVVAGRDIHRGNIDGVYSCVCGSCLCVCVGKIDTSAKLVRRLIVVLRRFFYSILTVSNHSLTHSLAQSNEWITEWINE